MVWNIERLQEKRLDETLCMMKDTIRSTDTNHYTQVQLNAWAEAIITQPSVKKRLCDAYTLIFCVHDRINGVGSLMDGHHVDFLFVANGRKREGIATLVMDHLEDESCRQGAAVLTTEASLIAVPFFKARGYEQLNEQEKKICGISMKNVQMFKNMHN